MVMLVVEDRTDPPHERQVVMFAPTEFDVDHVMDAGRAFGMVMPAIAFQADMPAMLESILSSFSAYYRPYTYEREGHP